MRFLGMPYLKSLSQLEGSCYMSLMSALREALKQHGAQKEHFRFMSMFEYLNTELGESWGLFV